MTLNISFPDTSPEAKLVKDMVASGHYEDEQAVLKAAMQDLQAAEKQRVWLREALEEGRSSGRAPMESLEDRLARLNKEAVARGLL